MAVAEDRGDDVPAGSTGPSLGAKILLAVVASLFAASLALGAAELTVRHREKSRETVPGTMFIYYPHQRLRQAFVRSSQYYQWVNINAQGFRGTRPVGAKVPGVPRVIAVGESTTFDVMVSADSLAWPARLESWIPRLDPACHVEVINAGVPGYRVLDNLIRLHTELLDIDPDVILYYPPHNDLFQIVRGGNIPDDPRRPLEAEYTSPFSRWLTDHSLLFAKVRSRNYMMRAREGGSRVSRETLTPEMLESGLQKYQEDIETFLAIAAARGVRVILIEPMHLSGTGTTVEPDSVIRSEWALSFPLLETEELLGMYTQVADAIHNAAGAWNAEVIRTSGFGVRGPEWFAVGDPIHFNDRGADLVARRLAESLTADSTVSLCSDRPVSGQVIRR